MRCIPLRASSTHLDHMLERACNAALMTEELRNNYPSSGAGAAAKRCAGKSPN